MNVCIQRRIFPDLSLYDTLAVIDIIKVPSTVMFV